MEVIKHPFFSIIEVSLLTILIRFTTSNSVNIHGLKSGTSPMSPRDFPFGEFFNISNKLWIEYASRKYSCEKRANANDCCSCNKNCMMYGTCCIDKLWKTNLHSNLQSYLSLFMKRFEEADTNLECKQVYPPMDGYSSQSYMMVSSCPSPPDTKGRTPCVEKAHNAVVLPVLGDDGLIYQNSHCALCNSVSAFSFMNFSFMCDSENEAVKMNFTESPMTSLKNCRARFIIPQETKTRLCSPDEDLQSEPRKRRCNDLCKAYSAPIAGYKNYHCATSHSAAILFTKHPSMVGCKQGRIWTPGTRWSVLINYYHSDIGPKIRADIISSRSKVKQRIAVNRCENEMAYQGIAKSHCSSASCPAGYDYKNSKCIRSDSAFNRPYGHCINPCFYLNAKSIFLVQRNLSNKSTIEDFMEKLLNRSISLMPVLSSRETLIINFGGDGADALLRKLTQSFSVVKPVLDEIEEIVISSQSNYDKLQTPEKGNWGNPRVYPDGRICEETYSIDPVLVDVSPSCHISMRDKIGKDHVIPLSELLSDIIIDENNTSLRINGCRKFHSKSSCIRRDLIALHQQELILRQGYVFCVVDTKIWTRVLEVIDGYLTFIGTLVGIVCHIISLTTFKIFPKTLPFGLVCLCVSFLLSDSFYVVVSGLYATKITVKAELCKCLAIGLHLSAIVVQSCSVLSAVDIATKFGVLKQNRQRGPLRKYVYRRVPALMSLSLTLVAVAFALDYLDIVDMGYGEKGMCVFNGYYGRLIFYITPNSVALILALSLVIFTLHKINKQNKKSETSFKLSSSSNRPKVNVAKITLKLVLAYGVSELVGLLQFPWDGEAVLAVNTVLAVLYDISRSLRGLIIFVVYICKPQVYRLYLYRFHIHCKNGRKKPEAVKTCRRRAGYLMSNCETKILSKNTIDCEIGLKNRSQENGKDKPIEVATICPQLISISPVLIMTNVEGILADCKEADEKVDDYSTDSSLQEDGFLSKGGDIRTLNAELKKQYLPGKGATKHFVASTVSDPSDKHEVKDDVEAGHGNEFKPKTVNA